jgi:hypothetical protein
MQTSDVSERNGSDHVAASADDADDEDDDEERP